MRLALTVGQVVVAALVAVPAMGVSGQEVHFVTEELLPDLYLVRGDPGGNVVVKIGNDGLVVVDAQSANVADSLVNAIRAFTAEPLALVINTHYHEDHIGGNGVLRDQGAVTFAHANVRRRAVVDTTIDELGWHREAALPRNIPQVDIAAGDVIRIAEGDVLLLAFGQAHTDGDLAVFFRDANVIHTGDLVEVDAYPFIDWWGGGSLDGTIAAVDTLLARGNAQTRFVPGHGRVVDASYLQDYRSMLHHVRDAVLSAIESGSDVQQTMDLGITSEWDDLRGGARAGRRFVGMLYLGLSQDMR